jgi:hypothetical protein
VAIIGGSNAWQASQVAKHNKDLGAMLNVREEDRQPKTSKRESKAQ